MTDDMLPEYSYITTVHDVPTPEGVLAAGAVGSIVMVYPEHRAYLVEFEAPWHVLSIGHDAVVPNDELNAELAATHERMSRPLSREQIVANELCAYIDLATPIEQWTNHDQDGGVRPRHLGGRGGGSTACAVAGGLATVAEDG
jgi:hypothetical protein